MFPIYIILIVALNDLDYYNYQYVMDIFYDISPIVDLSLAHKRTNTFSSIFIPSFFTCILFVIFMFCYDDTMIMVIGVMTITIRYDERILNNN